MLLYITIGLIFASCKPYPQDVRDALKQAKNNAPELEKVLEHYRHTDSEKYRAACFLIANMPYHESQQEITFSQKHNSYFATTDSLFNLYFGNMSAEEIRKKKFRIPDSIRNLLNEQYINIPKPIYTKGKKDIESITADFLIDNIESSFDVWKNTSLLQYMTFEEFKESILPYRTTDEPLLFKKSELRRKFLPIIDKEGMRIIQIPIERYKMYILKQQRISYYTKRKEDLGLYDLYLPGTMRNCHSQVTWTSNIFRSCGIPVCYEFTPQWPDRENRHFWNASPDSTGIYLPYSAPANNLKEDWDNHLKYAGKVYRKTFSVHKDTPFFIKAANEIIPEILSSPNLSDETYRYHQTITLELPFEIQTNNKVAYLSFITRSGIVPVAWGKIDKSRNKVTFTQVPLSMTFILSYYKDDCLKAIGNPFKLSPKRNLEEIPKPLTIQKNITPIRLSWTGKELKRLSGKIEEGDLTFQEFCVDTLVHIDMKLYRKYPLKEHLLKLHENLKGTYILASTALEGKYDTLAILAEKPTPEWQNLKIQSRKKYRFLSIRSLNRKPLYLAEIKFNGCIQPKKSNSFIPLELEVDSISKKVTDNNVETFTNTHTIQARLKQEAYIHDFEFIPRNANNFIQSGNMYALYYFHNGEWNLCKIQRAYSNKLDFNNVPAKGLYLLKCLNAGKEELPFTYTDKQYWISNP